MAEMTPEERAQKLVDTAMKYWELARFDDPEFEHNYALDIANAIRQAVQAEREKREAAEAEVARLRNDVIFAEGRGDDRDAAMEQLEAAEAEVARLRGALEHYAGVLEAMARQALKEQSDVSRHEVPVHSDTKPGDTLVTIVEAFPNEQDPAQYKAARRGRGRCKDCHSWQIDPEQSGWGYCERAASEDGEPKDRGSSAVAQDYEGYQAFLKTSEHHFCAMFSQADP